MFSLLAYAEVPKDDVEQILNVNPPSYPAERPYCQTHVFGHQLRRLAMFGRRLLRSCESIAAIFEGLPVTDPGRRWCSHVTEGPRHAVGQGSEQPLNPSTG